MEYGKYKNLRNAGNIKIIRKDADMYFERDRFDNDTGVKSQVFEGCPNIDFHKQQLIQFQAAVEGLEAIIADQQEILDVEEAATKEAKEKAAAEKAAQEMAQEAQN